MFKVGDMVYVAFAVGWKFETHLTTVKDVVEKDGEVKYIVECYCDAARFSNDLSITTTAGKKMKSLKQPKKEKPNVINTFQIIIMMDFAEVASMKILVLYSAVLTVAIVRIWDIRTQQIQDL